MIRKRSIELVGDKIDIFVDSKYRSSISFSYTDSKLSMIIDRLPTKLLLRVYHTIVTNIALYGAPYEVLPSLLIKSEFYQDCFGEIKFSKDGDYTVSFMMRQDVRIPSLVTVNRTVGLKTKSVGKSPNFNVGDDAVVSLLTTMMTIEELVLLGSLPRLSKKIKVQAKTSTRELYSRNKHTILSGLADIFEAIIVKNMNQN